MLSTTPLVAPRNRTARVLSVLCAGALAAWGWLLLPSEAVPGLLAFVAVYLLFPPGRTLAVLLAPFFVVYLAWGVDLRNAHEVQQAAWRMLAFVPVAWDFALSWTLFERGHRWGWLAFGAVALALAPSGLMLAVGLGVALLWQAAIQARTAAELGTAVRWQPRALAGLGLGAVLLAGALAFVGPWSWPRFAPAGATTWGAPAGAPAIDALPTVEGAPASPPVQPLVGEPSPQLEQAFQLLVSLVLLLVTLVLLAVWLRGRGGPGARWRGFWGALLLGTVIGLAVVSWLFFLGVLAPGEGSGGGLAWPRVAPPAPTAPAPASPSEAPATPRRVIPGAWGWLALALLALALLAVVLTWRWVLVDAGKAPDEPPPAREKRSVPTRADAGRVRAAYRRFLQAARRRLPRAGYETPWEYAQRFGARFPELAGAARGLTELYEPVRYGGRADGEEAARAEAWADALEAGLKEETL
ncbi:DUF4129 domain-containing protein [Oceanithermus sp.]